MARLQLSRVAALNIAAQVVTLSAVKSGSNDVAFSVSVAGTVEGAPINHTIVDDAGKVRVFRDADDFVKQAGALSMFGETQDVVMANLAVVAPKPFTGDVVKKNQATVATYTARKAAVDARIVTITQEIALMAADQTIPQAIKDEKAAQKASMEGLSAWLAAEIARINAILNPVPQEQ